MPTTVNKRDEETTTPQK